MSSAAASAALRLGSALRASRPAAFRPPPLLASATPRSRAGLLHAMRPAGLAAVAATAARRPLIPPAAGRTFFMGVSLHSSGLTQSSRHCPCWLPSRCRTASASNLFHFRRPFSILTAYAASSPLLLLILLVFLFPAQSHH